jgi:hypothetical protein
MARRREVLIYGYVTLGRVGASNGSPEDDETL